MRISLRAPCCLVRKELDVCFRRLLAGLSSHNGHRKMSTCTKSAAQRPFTVIVEGNIASGKTNFTNYFSNVAGIQVSTEPVDRWRQIPGGHNILALSYQDPCRWSMTLQTYVQLTMLQQHLDYQAQSVKLMERSIYSARYVFVENHYRRGVMTDVEHAILNEWFSWILAHHDCSVDLVVYLRTQPEICMKRIHNRGRKEELTIPMTYLQELHDLYDNWLIHKRNSDWIVPKDVLVLDANQDLDKIISTYQSYSNKLKNKLLHETVANAAL